MKRGALICVLLAALLVACGGSEIPEVMPDTLIVGDGTTSKSYSVADLEALSSVDTTSGRVRERLPPVDAVVRSPSRPD